MQKSNFFLKESNIRNNDYFNVNVMEVLHVYVEVFAKTK